MSEQIKGSREVPDEARELARQIFRMHKTVFSGDDEDQAVSLIHQYAESRQPTGLVQQEAGSGAVLSEVGSAGASGQGGGWSVSDAFALAGFPLKEGWEVFVDFSVDGDHYWIAGCDRDGEFAFVAGDGWDYTGSRWDGKSVNIANAPAVDCLKALPKCVASALAMDAAFTATDISKGLVHPPIDLPRAFDQAVSLAGLELRGEEIHITRFGGCYTTHRPELAACLASRSKAGTSEKHEEAEPSTTPTGVSLQVDKEHI